MKYTVRWLYVDPKSCECKPKELRTGVSIQEAENECEMLKKVNELNRQNDILLHNSAKVNGYYIYYLDPINPEVYY